MLDIANRFLKDPPSYGYFDTKLEDELERYLGNKLDEGKTPIVSAILTGDPPLLRLAGAQLLYLHLKREGHIAEPLCSPQARSETPVRFQNISS
jgi:hypothetical protein